MSPTQTYRLVLEALKRIKDLEASVASGGGGGSVSDGDKGDIVVSGSGSTWTIDASVIQTSNLGGDITTAGKALLDDANTTAQRTTLGLGVLSTAAITETEVDFGTKPKSDAKFTVTDATVTSGSKILVMESGKAATGRVAGDSQWDSISFSANPGSGQFTLYAEANPGPVVGKRKIQYIVG